MKAKRIRALLGAGVIACACTAFTGCGKEQVDVSGGFDLSFSGLDGYGVATLTDTYDWLDDVVGTYGEGMKGMEIYSLTDDLMNAVTYTVTPDEGVSNGDEVTVSVDVDSSKLEKYNFELKGGTATFTVSGLEEVEQIDPFENVVITFEGIAPLGKAKLDTSDCDKTLAYTIDKEKNLSNGDVITIVAEPKYGMDMDEYTMEYGKSLTATEKTYTVDGLAAYAKSLDEIPQETMDRMNQTYLDAYAAEIADLGTIKDMELLGNYIQTAKSSDTKPYNRFYFVYKITADFTANDKNVGVQEYYWCAYYENVMIMPDGTISVDYDDLHMGSHDYDLLTVKIFMVEGCADLDTLYLYNVTKRIDKYDIVSTVK